MSDVDLSPPNAEGPGPAAVPVSDRDRTIDTILATIKGKESGGNYTAQNGVSSASGAYQFVDGTWQTWLNRAIKAGLVDADNARFSKAKDAPPEVQDAVARMNVGSILDSANGRVDAVPRAWFVGNPNAANDYAPGGPGNGTTTVGDYVAGWMDRYQKAGGDTTGDNIWLGNSQPASVGSGTDPNVPGSTDGNDVLPQNASREDTLAYVKAHYGTMAAYIDHPEIGKILLDAGHYGWDETKLYEAVKDTEWWKQTSDARRKWDDTVRSDPATANRMRDERKRSISDQAATLGVPLSAEQVAQIAEDSILNGWEDAFITDNILTAVQAQGFGPGKVTATADAVTALYRQQLIPIGRNDALALATKVQSGEMTMDGIRSKLQGDTVSRYATNKDLSTFVQGGGTATDYFAGARAQAARELELGEDQIDLMDKKWRWIMEVPDGAGGTRQPTLTEVQYGARKDPSWKETNGARETFAGLGSALAQKFGL